jgi:coenzyme Q-binding protein COQ10
MRHHVSRILPYSPDQLFDMVGDVARYPEFVPWITTMRADPVRDLGEGRSSLFAEASVGFSFLKERFGTNVTRDSAARRIDVALVSGPFKRLQNGWAFRPHPQGCEVVFDIDFEFKSKVLDLLLKANFGLAVDRLIACFESRARALYGPARAAASPKPLRSAAPGEA